MGRFPVQGILPNTCIQKFPDRPLGTRNVNDRALCHCVQLYRYFVSQFSEFCSHNTLCCSSSVYYCKRIYRYRFSPETFGYTLVYAVTYLLWPVTEICKLLSANIPRAGILHLVSW